MFCDYKTLDSLVIEHKSPFKDKLVTLGPGIGLSIVNQFVPLI